MARVSGCLDETFDHFWMLHNWLIWADTFDGVFRRAGLEQAGRGRGRVPDGHEAQQRPAGVVNLRRAALDVTALLTRLKVLPPASVGHLVVQQELTGFLNLHTHVTGNTRA